MIRLCHCSSSGIPVLSKQSCGSPSSTVLVAVQIARLVAAQAVDQKSSDRACLVLNLYGASGSKLSLAEVVPRCWKHLIIHSHRVAYMLARRGSDSRERTPLSGLPAVARSHGACIPMNPCCFVSFRRRGSDSSVA